MFKRVELAIAGLMLAIGVAIGGCASLTPVSQANKADLVLTQVAATVDTVDILVTGLDKDGQSPEALRITKVVLTAMKPQIVAWIGLIEQLNTSNEQYVQAQELRTKLDAAVVKIDSL